MVREATPRRFSSTNYGKSIGFGFSTIWLVKMLVIVTSCCFALSFDTDLNPRVREFQKSAFRKENCAFLREAFGEIEYECHGIQALLARLCHHLCHPFHLCCGISETLR